MGTKGDAMSVKAPINKLLQEVHGDKSSAFDRAANAIVGILHLLHPKFDEEYEAGGYEADADGYVDQFEWSADTIDTVAQILHLHGFGPEYDVRQELEMAFSTDDE